eukprot:scaffold53688_cov55-Attheya_sp.AAC.1
MPQNGSLQEKINRNSMACTDASERNGEAGLFLTLSRINHHCLGNSDHQFLAHRGVKILVASCGIQKGEEVKIAYTAVYKPREERRAHLLRIYKFQCSCSGCEDDAVEMKLAKANELDEGILTTGSRGKVELALRRGQALLKIYDELNCSTWLYQRTYYDLFQVAITKKKFVEDGRKYIRKTYEAALAYTSDDQDPSVQRFRDLMDAPHTHRNYLWCAVTKVQPRGQYFIVNSLASIAIE